MYFANLVYTLLTHRDVFAFAHDGDVEPARSDRRHWPLWQALAVLGAATVATTAEAHLMSVGLEASASAIGFSPFFFGVILSRSWEIPPSSSPRYTLRGAAASGWPSASPSDQRFRSRCWWRRCSSWCPPSPPSDEPGVFEPAELVAIAAVAFAVNAVTRDGETTWFEGVLLVSIYVLLALAFYFI